MMYNEQINDKLAEFKRKLKPELMLGITSPSPHSLDAICKSNIDFVILDQEHASARPIAVD